VRLVGTPYAILKVPTLRRQALHDLEDVAARSAFTGAGQVAYRLSDLEFVIAHIVTRPFATLTVSRNPFSEVRVGVAHLGGCPAPNDHSMPTTSRAADAALTTVRHVIVRVGPQDEQSPLGRYGEWRNQ
jgi:hypothetical protein